MSHLTSAFSLWNLADAGLGMCYKVSIYKSNISVLFQKYIAKERADWAWHCPKHPPVFETSYKIQISTVTEQYHYVAKWGKSKCNNFQHLHFSKQFLTVLVEEFLIYANILVGCISDKKGNRDKLEKVYQYIHMLWPLIRTSHKLILVSGNNMFLVRNKKKYLRNSLKARPYPEHV